MKWWMPNLSYHLKESVGEKKTTKMKAKITVTPGMVDVVECDSCPKSPASFIHSDRGK